MSHPDTLSREEALKLILSSIRPVETITLPLEETLGCAASDDLYAAEDIPRFERAAMDGYSVRSQDTVEATPERPVRLRVVGRTGPGTSALPPMEAGQAVRTVTGGPMPPGADAVVKEEDTEGDDAELQVLHPIQPGHHVRRKGSDLKRGTLILDRGRPITPGILGILAELQIRNVAVIRRPRISIVSIGDELIDLHDTMTNHDIVASNLYTLSAMIKQHGGTLRHTRICADDRTALRQEIQEGLQGDMLITTGGSSNAYADITRAVLADMGLEIKFAGLSMRPGKGTSFGLIGTKPVFCLPGTPSAVHVVFHVLVWPALLRQMGYKFDRPARIDAVLEEGIRKKSGTEHIVQGRLSKEQALYRVRPLVGPDVGVLSSMGRANALIFVSPRHSVVKQGEAVSVQPLDPFGLPFLETHGAPSALETDRGNALPPVVSIVGKSDSGKTTLLEKLVPELRVRGYRVGTIKHDVHGFDIDHKGKDSWRHKQSGARTVVISSPRKIAVVKDVDIEESLDSLVSKYFTDVDIVLTEGYKKEDKPKIEIFRAEIHDAPLCLGDGNLVALVSDDRLNLEAPRFGLEDIKGLADLVEARFLAASNQAVR
jgi:molybdopterin molybdotransferase